MLIKQKLNYYRFAIPFEIKDKSTERKAYKVVI